MIELFDILLKLELIKFSNTNINKPDISQNDINEELIISSDFKIFDSVLHCTEEKIGLIFAILRNFIIIVFQTHNFCIYFVG